MKQTIAPKSCPRGVPRLRLCVPAGLAGWFVLAAAAFAEQSAPPGSGAEVAPEVLAAQQQRMEVIARASQAAVAIFAGEAGGGSGVLISADGYALTNFHVVQPAGVAMQCGLADGRQYEAVLVGLDPTGDVALIKLLGRDDFPSAVLADSDAVEVGDFCFAAGNPFLLATDFHPSISAGIVSGVHRYQFPAGTILEYADCLQVDAAINPGNSGGALFDAEGRIIGLNGRASFEKRGRVNVGVGYAISANQLRHFLGCLKGGRLVDHATLGATAATAEDGRVVVSDILDSSDAYRRGLRYDDEIVALAGRTVRTVNALKNVLGTLPAGWRVPLVYRRQGRRHEILVRLAGVHSAAELAAIVAGENSKQTRRPRPAPPAAPQPAEKKSEPPAHPAPDQLSAAVQEVYEARPGFTNYHFNTVELSRVARSVAALHSDSGRGTWVLAGHLGSGEPFRIELADARATIDLPTGTTSVEASGDLDANPSPPGSGGMLAALIVWRRLVLDGPGALGRTSYWGTVPLDPAALASGAEPVLIDLLETAVAGVETRISVTPSGAVAAIDLWTAPDADPCELTCAQGLATSGIPAGWPARIEARHSDKLFGVFHIEAASVQAAAPQADSPADSGGATGEVPRSVEAPGET